MNPKNLALFAEYGIIKERIASLATDAIRAKLLEIHGYKSQIIEFTSLEHTQKNLFLRARKKNIKSNISQAQKMENIAKITQEFGFSPTLLKLLESCKLTCKMTQEVV
jgi:adenylate cyclase